MAEIILCNRRLSANYLQNSCGLGIDTLEGLSCLKPNSLSSYTPYLVNNDLSPIGRSIVTRLSPKPVAKEITNLSLSFGSDNTLALAEMTKKLQEYNIGLIGASTSVYANRISGFASAVKNYQDALMEYRASIKARSALKTTAKQKAFAAFQKMQIQFKHELNAINHGIRARRGTSLSSVERAINIAKSSRNVAKLSITDQIQANNLVKFSKHANYLGNGLAVIDFTSRVGNINNSYRTGENWERELFIESSSFALSAGSGIIAVNAGTAALGILIAATPRAHSTIPG